MKVLKCLGFGAVAACFLFLGLQMRSAGAKAGPEGPSPGIVRLDPTVKLTNFTPQVAPAEGIYAVPGHPVPLGAYKELFSTAAGEHIGVWEAGPGILRVVDYPHDEYCVMLSGVVTVTSDSGHSETFRAGDSFVIPKGFRGTWDMKTKMRKELEYVEAASH